MYHARVRWEIHDGTKYELEHLKKRDHLEHLGVDKSIILK